MNDTSRFCESLERLINDVKQKTSTIRDHLSEASDRQVTIAGDSIDRAVGIGELNTRIEIHERYVKESRQLRDAKLRIAGGTFGFCDECSDSIDPRRLAIIPHADCCFSCQAERERFAVPEQEPIAWVGWNDIYGRNPEAA
jgi:DnaK suppressor protein